jgi:hypothetical protein
MLIIKSGETNIAISSEMKLSTRGLSWRVRVPKSNIQVCEALDIDPVEDVEEKALQAIIAFVLAQEFDDVY